mmetsp:Transcript_4982/g.9369  ORF Transcript_4982/g.9369 Transcript_4982/m.9369 type:complete len:152 (+) Transcript_4982:76-531(+)
MAGPSGAKTPSTFLTEQAEADADFARMLQNEQDEDLAREIMAADALDAAENEAAWRREHHIALQQMQENLALQATDDLQGAAHRHLQHLGRKTARKIQDALHIGGSLKEFLSFANKPGNLARILSLADDGQRLNLERDLHSMLAKHRDALT